MCNAQLNCLDYETSVSQKKTKLLSVLLVGKQVKTSVSLLIKLIIDVLLAFESPHAEVLKKIRNSLRNLCKVFRYTTSEGNFSSGVAECWRSLHNNFRKCFRATFGNWFCTFYTIFCRYLQCLLATVMIWMTAMEKLEAVSSYQTVNKNTTSVIEKVSIEVMQLF